MSFVETDSPPASKIPPLPQLPEGWRYTDELSWDDSPSPLLWRRWLLFVLAGVVVAALVVGLIVLNAQVHYSRGSEALRNGAYDLAATELSQARLVVLSYRDAPMLVEQARRDLAVQESARKDAQARVDAVTGALSEAGASLARERMNAALAALESVPVSDLRGVARDDADTAQVAEALTRDLTAAATAALDRLQWGRAADGASALLLLDPGSSQAARLADQAAAGRKLSERLGKAQDAARRGQWRTALRLALSVTAVRKDFPGAGTLIAKARTALAPKPSPKPSQTPTVATTTAPATTTGTTGGSSSGSPPAPPPP